MAASTTPCVDPVGLAQEEERLGYDFVSVADHPGGSTPSYETLALLTVNGFRKLTPWGSGNFDPEVVG